MKFYVLNIILIVLGLNTVYAQKIDLTEKKDNNHLMDVFMSTHIEGNQLHVVLGDGSRLKDLYGREITLWLFYEPLSFHALEKVDIKVYALSSFRNEIAREGFAVADYLNLTLESKLKFVSITHNYEWTFTINEPTSESLLTLPFYASEYLPEKKKDIRFFTSLKPVSLNIPKQTTQNKKNGINIEIETGDYHKAKDSIAYVGFSKNISEWLTEAEKLLKTAKTEHASGNTINEYIQKIEELKSDLDWDKETFRSEIRDDETVKQGIKRLEAIYKEMLALNIQPINGTSAGEEAKTKDPVWYIIFGTGGILLSGLLMLVVNSIIQTLKDKKRDKKLANIQKKQIEDQERIMRETQQVAQSKDRKRI